MNKRKQGDKNLQLRIFSSNYEGTKITCSNLRIQMAFGNHKINTDVMAGESQSQSNPFDSY